MNKPPRTYSVKVPTKAYLRKYIYARWGQPGLPLKLDYTTIYGTMILCLLDKESFTIAMSDRYKEVRTSYFKDHVEFVAPITSMHFRGHSLSQDKVIAINRFFEDFFVEDLYRFCKHHIDPQPKQSRRPGIDKAIYSFADMYGIDLEDDITFEALKKAEWRYRKKHQEKMLSFVPSLKKPSQSLFFPQFPALQFA